MSDAAAPSVDDALSGLVSQFSSALDCYRELVQNSIDAGSPRVDVWLEFLSAGRGKGTIAIHVDDFGEGMDENIIDTQLTRLFASTKEDDLTKIGKFGIGFVSVFALNPRGVLIHTGRGGEYWEVLFHEDRTFTKGKIESPVEGTQVTLFVEGSRQRYVELVDGSRAALKRWCAHSDTEVTFEDRLADTGAEVINQPFAVAGDVMTEVHHQGTDIVLAYAARPDFGFYNKGLTLLHTADAEEALGEHGGRFRHIGFRMKSRYLEHTLSRETILRDRNYDKAVTLLREAADGPLRESLAATLETIAAGETLPLDEQERYLRLCAFLCEEPAEALLELDARPMLRSVDGAAVSLRDVGRAASRDGRVLISAERTRLTDSLRQEGVVTLLGRLPPHRQVPALSLARGDEQAQALEPVRSLVLRYLIAQEGSTLLGRAQQRYSIDLRADAFSPSQWVSYDPHLRYAAMLSDPHTIYLAVSPVPRPSQRVRGLLDAATAVLSEADLPYRRLSACRLDTQELNPPLFVVGRKVARLMARPPPGIGEEERAKRPEAAVNVDHPHFEALLQTWSERPPLAAYGLAKALLLAEDRLLHRDVALIAAAQEVVPAAAGGT